VTSPSSCRAVLVRVVAFGYTPRQPSSTEVLLDLAIAHSLTRYDERAGARPSTRPGWSTRRTGHRVGANAVAGDAARGAEGVKEQRRMTACARKHDYVATGPGSPVAQPIVC
jgi:hypothetical protein